VKHSNVHQLLSSFCHDFNLSARDRFLHQTSLCFDTSILQIFPALAIGATVYIATKDTRKDPSELATFLHQSSITVTYFTPTHFSLLLDTSTETLRKCSSYRWAFFGGERVPPQLIKAFYELRTPATAYNGWGPSELTVHCTMQKISESELETSSIPIGSPLANCHVYIVDSKLNPLPVGVSGEICVAGAHTVSGYINRVEESGRRFPINPYASHSDKSRGWLTLHRSGDRGRFLNSGYIEFQGRLSGDKQVKLRGFRIDLGEIEQSLLDASDNGNGQDIAAVSVVARDLAHHTPDLMDDRQIIAFFVPARPTNAETLHNFVNELQNKIKNRLNGYMLPNGYQVLDKMPVTIGGKLDQQNLQRRALNLIFPSTRQHTPSTTLQMQISANDTHPSPEVLAEIVSLFKDVLALPEDRIIHGATNFFDVGGQSIRLVRLQAKIKTATKVKVPLPILFQNPTPFAIARWVCSELRSLAGNARTGQVLNKFLDWATETTLPNDPRYTVSTEIGSRPRSEVSNILVTGPESFVGIHLLATLLTTRLATKIYVLGSLGSIGIAELENLFKQYRLLDHTWTTSVLATRLRTFTGSLAKPHFGLDPRQFTDLGVQLHAIYHMGTEVSILKTYTDLKNVNIRGTLDIIELASHGLELTEIHYVSTQSVSHLQTWETTHRNTGSIVTHEETVEHFTPPATDEHGYFKARWAAEMLMTKAARRGFAISIYRFSAATASRLTGVPNPATDLVPLMIKMMLEHRCIPDFVGKELPFMIDFIPVDHLVSAFHHLSTHGLPVDFRPSGWNTASPTIHHICNPNPLPLTDLLTKMNLVSNESDVQYRVVPAGQWVEAVKSGHQSPVEELRLNALKTYLDLGHIMFALDTTRTKETLRKIGCDAVDTCPPVDVEYLRQMTGDNA
jgi:thioester reductase-like protein